MFVSNLLAVCRQKHMKIDMICMVADIYINFFGKTSKEWSDQFKLNRKLQRKNKNKNKNSKKDQTKEQFADSEKEEKQ